MMIGEEMLSNPSDLIDVDGYWLPAAGCPAAFGPCCTALSS
jgi:hypothetical protein